MGETMSNLKFRAVLFDLDGTLIDHFTAIHKCVNYAFEKVGAPQRSFEEIKRNVGGSHEKLLHLFVTDAQFPEVERIYREMITGAAALDGVFLLDGARETLEQLQTRGVKMAVLTNKWGKVTRRLLEHLEVHQFFDAMVGVEDTQWRKPEKELTDYTMKKLGVTAKQTLMVGDSPFDVATGRNAGLKVCAVATGTHSREQLELEKPDWLVNSLRDVIRIVERGA